MELNIHLNVKKLEENNNLDICMIMFILIQLQKLHCIFG
nr:MAG TPA: hypothetical protein [Caudoviricetes sp.]